MKYDQMCANDPTFCTFSVCTYKLTSNVNCWWELRARLCIKSNISLAIISHELSAMSIERSRYITIGLGIVHTFVTLYSLGNYNTMWQFAMALTISRQSAINKQHYMTDQCIEINIFSIRIGLEMYWPLTVIECRVVMVFVLFLSYACSRWRSLTISSFYHSNH